jgi:hypothetical protein
MIVKRIVKSEDGNIEATLMLTPEQASFFMNVGLGVLVHKGAATIMDYTEEEFRKEVETAKVTAETTVTTNEAGKSESDALSEARAQFLQEVDIKILPKA